MRRTLGYILSVVTGYLVARHLHAIDAHWGWYNAGPGTNSDDPLALIAWLAVSAVGCWVVYQVVPSKKDRRF